MADKQEWLEFSTYDTKEAAKDLMQSLRDSHFFKTKGIKVRINEIIMYQVEILVPEEDSND